MLFPNIYRGDHVRHFGHRGHIKPQMHLLQGYGRREGPERLPLFHHGVDAVPHFRDVPGSARMLRFPRARGPYSILPRYQAITCRPRSAAAASRRSPPDCLEPHDLHLVLKSPRGQLRSRSREYAGPQQRRRQAHIFDLRRPAKLDRALLPVQLRRRPRPAERKLRRTIRSGSDFRWPCSSGATPPASAKRLQTGSLACNGRRYAIRPVPGTLAAPRPHRDVAS